MAASAGARGGRRGAAAGAGIGRRPDGGPRRHNTPLAIGDRVRLTIESSNNGYLYVIDRELDADGTKSDPYLIFPTARTREGDNAVRGGRLVDIPGSATIQTTSR